MVVEIKNLPEVASAQDRYPHKVPVVTPIVLVFHDGSVDLFDMGAQASAELAALATESLVAPLVEQLRSSHPDAVVNIITNSHRGPEGFDPRPVTVRRQNLDPVRHRYFSYLGRLNPSDDAFLGNDDPMRFELFDASGTFLGPLVFEIAGREVLDAGVAANDEQDVAWLHRVPTDPVISDQGAIALHPGYVGSIVDESGGQPGILGVPGAACDESGDPSTCFHLDPVAGDFKRPGQVLARIRVTSGIDGSYGGFWYDPARSGEGFNVVVAEGKPPQVGLAWYTYAADGSGAQVYLTGSGEVQYRSAEIEMFTTAGGQFASTSNPETVERESWGVVRLEFQRCSEATLAYEPSVPGFEAGSQVLQRLTPVPQGTGTACGEYSLGLFDAADDTWPFPEDVIAPDPGPPVPGG